MRIVNNGRFRINQKMRFDTTVWDRWLARRESDAITRAALAEGIQEMRSTFTLVDRQLQRVPNQHE